MSLALTYDEDTTNAVEIALGGLVNLTGTLLADAVTAIVQRSYDGGVTWRTVRGMAEAPINSSGDMEVYPSADYEFRAGVENAYRSGYSQSVVDTGNRTVASGGWGTGESGQAWTGTNAQLDATGGWLRVVHDSAAQTIVPRLAGLPTLADFTAAVTINTTAVTTGAANNQGMHFRRVDSSNYYDIRVAWATAGTVSITVRKAVAGSFTTLSSSASSITYTGSSTLRLEIECRGTDLRYRLWDLASSTPPSESDWVEEAGILTDFASGELAAYSRRETGNTNVNATQRFRDWVIDDGSPALLGSTFDEEITPDTAQVWIHSTTRPFLNRAPMIIGYADPQRTGRGELSEVNGRTLPQYRAELASSRRITLELYAVGDAQRDDYDLVYASGDVFYVISPLGCSIPSGYFRVDSSAFSRFRPRGTNRRLVLPMTECAQPGPDVAAALATWDSVIGQYGTWADVVAAYPTWEDLLEQLEGDATEVVVP